MNKKATTKADYVDIEFIVNQRGDKFVGVGCGHSLEDTLRNTKERATNPPRVNVVVPVVTQNKNTVEEIEAEPYNLIVNEKVIIYYFKKLEHLKIAWFFSCRHNHNNKINFKRDGEIHK